MPQSLKSESEIYTLIKLNIYLSNYKQKLHTVKNEVNKVN